MAYTYQFEDHLREHRPSRLGQRLWWMPAVAGVALVIASGVYLADTRSGHLSVALAVLPPVIAGTLFLVASAALSIADWTYRSEKYYREARHAAASKALAYIVAGRRTRGEVGDYGPLRDQTSQRPAGAHVRSGFAGVVGEEGDLDAVVELELLEHARDVRLDGGDAHVELAADLGV